MRKNMKVMKKSSSLRGTLARPINHCINLNPYLIFPWIWSLTPLSLYHALPSSVYLSNKRHLSSSYHHILFSISNPFCLSFSLSVYLIGQSFLSFILYLYQYTLLVYPFCLSFSIPFTVCPICALMPLQNTGWTVLYWTVLYPTFIKWSWTVLYSTFIKWS